MTVEITSRDTFEPTDVAGSFKDVIQELELTATKNNHFALLREIRPDGTQAPVALEMRNITRVREKEDRGDDFVGR